MFIKPDCDQFLGSSPERAVSCRPNGGQLMAADGDPPKKLVLVSTKSICDQFLGSSPERAVGCRPNGGQLMAADGDPPKKSAEVRL